LDGLSKASSDIVAGSRQFKSSAQELEFALKLKQFAPVALMIFLLLLLIYMVPLCILCFWPFVIVCRCTGALWDKVLLHHRRINNRYLNLRWRLLLQNRCYLALALRDS